MFAKFSPPAALSAPRRCPLTGHGRPLHRAALTLVGIVLLAGVTLPGLVMAAEKIAPAELAPADVDRGAVGKVAYLVRPSPQGDGVSVTATFTVQVQRAPVRVRITDVHAALTSVRDGRRALVSTVARGWHEVLVRGVGSHTVVASFRLAVDRSHGQPQLKLPLSRVPITLVEAEVTGEHGVQFEPAVPLETQVVGKGARAVSRARAFLPPADAVTIRWTESRAAPEQLVRLNTKTWQLVHLEEGVVRSTVVLDYEVIRGELNTLAVQIPADVVVYKITGADVEDWRTYAAQDGRPRQVQISLGASKATRRSLTMQLERVAPRRAGAALTVPVVRPLGAFRELGVIALFDGKKVGFAALERPAGFTPAGQDALPSHVRKTLHGQVNQAFKHIGAPGALVTKIAAARAHEVRFDARITTLYDVAERSLQATTAMLIAIKSGRLDRLIISLPMDANEPKVTAPSLNKVSPAKGVKVGKGRRAWEIRFTQALEGALQLQVAFDVLLPKALGTVVVPDLRVHGAEVEEGSLALTAEASIELKPDPAKELRPVAVADLPRALRRQSERELLFGFHYSHAPWRLQMTVQRHRTVQTLDAMVTRAWLTTHVLDNGHLSTRARYEVRNTDRQFVRLTLPAHAKVLAVQANGRRIQPVQDKTGAIAIPLPKDKTLLLDLRYEVKVDALGWFGGIDLVAPGLDVRQGELRWTVQTPASHGVFGISSNLRAITTEGWQTPPEPVVVPGRGGLTVPMPRPESPVSRHFSYAVREPDEPPLQISFSYSGVPESTAEGLLFFLTLLLLGATTWRGLRAGRLDRTGIMLLGGGLLCVGLEASVWGVSVVEVIGLVVVCGFIGGLVGLGRVLSLSRRGVRQGGA